MQSGHPTPVRRCLHVFEIAAQHRRAALGPSLTPVARDEDLRRGQRRLSTAAVYVSEQVQTAPALENTATPDRLVGRTLGWTNSGERRADGQHKGKASATGSPQA